MDTSGRPISGGEPATGMIVDEMPEASDQEMLPTSTDETATLVVNGNDNVAELAVRRDAAAGEESSSHLSSSIIATPAATSAIKKPNV